MKEDRQELTHLKTRCQVAGLGNIGIYSEVMKEIFRKAGKLHADRSIPVLIEGETGTGKEVVARYIHYGDGSVTAPFIDLNCAAIAPSVFDSELFGYEAGAFTGGIPGGQKGKLDIAAGGTLFLDEIAEMPVSLQSKLLRVIQEKEFYRVGGLKKIKVDVRFICATNAEINKKIADGTFRKDLYYRLNIGQIYMPPLRERKEEIIPLAMMFLNEMAAKKGKLFRKISKEAVDLLLFHDWPGNIRELKNAVEWAMLMGDDYELKPAHLAILNEARNDGVPKTSHSSIDIHNFLLPPDRLPLNDYVNNVIRKALDMHQGNKTETAKYLGISRRSLYCRLKYL